MVVKDITESGCTVSWSSLEYGIIKLDAQLIGVRVATELEVELNMAVTGMLSNIERKVVELTTTKQG